mmetsp:Transcript_28446/g.51549  ORF Transcript_28446/g.51549 Transcript_28446/m.51549 type:complete len:130 (+) Transcript_28446:863-1252(+)
MHSTTDQQFLLNLCMTRPFENQLVVVRSTDALHASLPDLLVRADYRPRSLHSKIKVIHSVATGDRMLKLLVNLASYMLCKLVRIHIGHIGPFLIFRLLCSWAPAPVLSFRRHASSCSNSLFSMDNNFFI